MSSSAKVAQGKAHLPLPRGPHPVGFVDYGDNQALTRIYYPTKDDNIENQQKWPIWAEDDYITGLLTFMKAMAHRWPSWAPRGEYEHFDHIRKLSSWVPQTGFPNIFRLLNGRVHIPIISGAHLNRDQKWPLVVFSHGLGCARFTYSQICYDIASYGFIVVAVEHRDGSACLSYNFDENGKKIPVYHRRVEHSDDEYSVRNAQVRQRCQEACQALDLALTLNSCNDSQESKLQNFCQTPGEADVFSMFRDSMDTTSPVICGHSFGGATTLMALASDPRFKIGLVLDGWLFPIRDEDQLHKKVKQKPILFVNTESFLNEQNLSKMATFAEAEEQPLEAKRICKYIKGSVHQNHIDAPFIMKFGKIRRMLGMHSDTCPALVLSLNNKLMVQFIRDQLDQDCEAEITDDLNSHANLFEAGFGTDHLTVKPAGCP